MDERDLSPERKWLFRELGEKVVASLQKHHINAWFVPDRTEALPLIMGLIPEGVKVVRGDSVTLDQIGVIPELIKRDRNPVVDPFARLPDGHAVANWEERNRMFREAFTADIFMTGANAVTLDGKIVSTDALGNRVAAVIYGPEKVILAIGANKIVRNLDEAIERVHRVAAPINARRHADRHHNEEFGNLPCARTGICADCSGEWRMCCNTIIVEAAWARVKGRMNVVIVGEELGI